MAIVVGILLVLGNTSCKKKPLDIHADFILEGKVIRIPGNLVDRKVELQLKIKQLWPYAGAKYFVEYIPVLGSAMVSAVEQPLLQAKQKYLVPLKEFTLYHSSTYRTLQRFRIAVSDDLGNRHELEFFFEVQLPDHGPNPEK